MVTLSSGQRTVLERVVLRAREVAERGVRKRFAALDLTGTAAPAGLTGDDRALRNALRDRARKLGRGRIDSHLATHEATRAGEPFLVEELAYETWHRMLFARYLAENDLLVHPEYGVALSVDDVRDLAAEHGTDPWELAAEFAGARLPGLFRLQTPLQLASEDRQDLTKLLVDMDDALFTATDSLGWVYQYWQSKRKDEVNASGDKITGNTLSPVTQLFTEDYMVDFLLQNSLGAWYVSRNPETQLKESWPYLRYREDGTPAAGTFPTWPETVAEVTVMDPCCGSGHFLVAALHMLVEMRQEQEGLDSAEATDAVLRDNLFGLELDARCTQIATFAVAMEAWKLGGHPETNLPHIACSGIPVGGQKEDWVKLAKGDANLTIALENLYEQFSQASELGSLISPKRAISMTSKTRRDQQGFALAHDWERIEQRMLTALEHDAAGDPSSSIFHPSEDDLVGTIRAAQLLGNTYTLVVTNVPYLSRGSQSGALRGFADGVYPEAKGDLATVMLQRCLEMVASGDDAQGNPVGAGTVASVTPQNWLFLGAYKKLRQKLLKEDQLDVIARLGARAFRAISGEVVNVALPMLTATDATVDHVFAGIDVSDAPNADAKDEMLQRGEFELSEQAHQLKNPDQRIALGQVSTGSLLSNYARCLKGITTGDDPRYRVLFWEIADSPDEILWKRFLSTVETSVAHGGRRFLVSWLRGVTVPGIGGVYIRGTDAWGKLGVHVSQMGTLPVTLYTGEAFDTNSSPIIPKNPDHLPAIWAFCSSPEFNTAVRKIDSALKVTNASLVKVPFDLEYWQKVADEKYPDGLPEPYSSDPTQWLFDGTIPGSDHPLHVAMARLLGYRWPDQTEDGLDTLVDTDGIVPLTSLRGEQPADQRLRTLLRTAYGDAWSPDLLQQLLRDVEARSLEEWLRARRASLPSM